MPAAERFDLIVIGAGINGAAIAREAALSGLCVGVFEQDDLGSGTSATSTRLIHGGLRYLEHAELSLVFESLAERERLLRLAPHLVEPLGLYLPIYAGAKRKPWQIRAGMLLYDALSIMKSLPKHRMLGRDAMLERLPALRPDGLLGGAHYYDAQVRFPERLVLENLLGASEQGAAIRLHACVVDLVRETGRVRGIHWRDSDGRQGHAVAPLVVNAAGPWVDAVAGPITGEHLIGGTKGSHLILTPFPGAPGAAIYVEAKSDGRPFFILPWNGLYLIGTTDRRFSGDPSQARIDTSERDYLLRETDQVLAHSVGLRSHIAYTQSGIRPLPYREGGATGAITRRHWVHAHRDPRGLFSVIGGKLTTHRALAEDVMRVLRRCGAPVTQRSASRDRPLPGAIEPREPVMAALQARFAPRHAERLWRIYGARSLAIAELVTESAELGVSVPVSTAASPALAAPDALPDDSDPVTARPGSTGRLLVAELVHALNSEMACSLIDILQRRCMAGLDADFGLRLAPGAAESLRRLGLWDRARAEQELEAYCRYANRHDAPG